MVRRRDGEKGAAPRQNIRDSSARNTAILRDEQTGVFPSELRSFESRGRSSHGHGSNLRTPTLWTFLGGRVPRQPVAPLLHCEFPTHSTRPRSVHRHSTSTGRLPPDVKIGRDEITCAKVYFVRSLTVKRGVRELCVVFPDIVLDEAAESTHGVEVIEKEPCRFSQ